MRFWGQRKGWWPQVQGLDGWIGVRACLEGDKPSHLPEGRGTGVQAGGKPRGAPSPVLGLQPQFSLGMGVLGVLLVTLGATSLETLPSLPEARVPRRSLLYPGPAPRSDVQGIGPGG